MQQTSQSGPKKGGSKRPTFEQNFQLYLQHQEQKYHSQHASCTKSELKFDVNKKY